MKSGSSSSTSSPIASSRRLIAAAQPERLERRVQLQRAARGLDTAPKTAAESATATSGPPANDWAPIAPLCSWVVLRGLHEYNCTANFLMAELLSTYLRPQWSRVALLAALLLGGIGLQLYSPQVIRAFLDAVAAGAAQEVLLGAGALFLVAALGGRALGLAASYAAEAVAWTATNALRADLFLQCLRLDMPFHKQHTPGELIERVDGDVQHLANFFSQFTLQVLGNGVLVAGILALLWRENAFVGLGLTLYTLLVLAILRAVQGVAAARWQAERQAAAELFGYIEERISGAEDVRAAGAEQHVLYRLLRRLRALLERRRAAQMTGNLTYVLTGFLFMAGYTAGLALGAYLYTRGLATIGTAFLIVYYIGMLADPLNAIRRQFEDLQQAAAGILRVNELRAQRPQVQAAARPRALPPGALSVACDGVSFRYAAGEGDARDGEPAPADESWRLRDVSFDLHPGRVLGVLGRTGSGKTTLARLLFRLYDPGRGAIRLGGVDLRETGFDVLRTRVGMVTQDVQLFQANVRDNLTFFDRTVTDARLEAVLRDLRLWDWVQSLPRGLDTPLAAGGQGLSAGEAQLLAFTRVFLKDPGLLILDEASSRLDPATETLLEQAVDRLFAGRTGIVIAHRLRTVQRADDILILENGAIVEFGARAELAARADSRFAALLRAGLEEALA
jgi:ATP-binding cassette subfamily B protein